MARYLDEVGAKHLTENLIEMIEEIPEVDLSNYATKEYVTNEINEAALGGGDGSVVDLSIYATKTELNAKADTSHQHTLSDVTDYAAPEIPSLDGYATETYVTNAIADAQLSGNDTVDLSGYAKVDHTHIMKDITDYTEQDLSSYATKTYVDEAVANIDISGTTGSYENIYDVVVREGGALKQEASGDGLANSLDGGESTANKTINVNQSLDYETEALKVIPWYTYTYEEDGEEKESVPMMYPTFIVLATDKLDANTLSTSEDIYFIGARLNGLFLAKARYGFTDSDNNPIFYQYQSLASLSDATFTCPSDLHVVCGSMVPRMNVGTTQEIYFKFFNGTSCTLDNGDTYDDVTSYETSRYLLNRFLSLTDNFATESIKYTIEEWAMLVDEATKGNTVDLTNYATKDEIPDVSGFITAVPDEYVTETELTAKGYLTEHQDLSNYALKSEIPDISNLATKDEIPDVTVYQTTDQVNALIDEKLGVIENGSY